MREWTILATAGSSALDTSLRLNRFSVHGVLGLLSVGPNAVVSVIYIPPFLGEYRHTGTGAVLNNRQNNILDRILNN